MFHIKPPAWLGLAGTLACVAAIGQQIPPGSPVAPASAPAPYRSALEGYRPFSDEKVRPWKESNATVEKIGGWRAYAKEAQDTKTSEPVVPSKPAAPHSGHSKP